MFTTRYICLQTIIVLIEHTLFFIFYTAVRDGIHTEPYTQGNLQAHLDNLINSGKITPMIVVTPDTTRNGSFENNTYYMNDADG